MWKTTFLIFAASVYFHASILETSIVLIGCFGFDSLDRWMAARAKNKARNKVFDEETDGWVPDPDDPEWEIKGELSRVKLTGKDQIIVTRIAELLRTMP